MDTTVSPTAASQNVLAFIRESPLLICYCMTALTILTCIEIFHKQKIFIGFKISWGQPFMKIGSLENLAHEYFFHENFCVYGTHLCTSGQCFYLHCTLLLSLSMCQRIKSSGYLLINCFVSHNSIEHIVYLFFSPNPYQSLDFFIASTSCHCRCGQRLSTSYAQCQSGYDPLECTCIITWIEMNAQSI